MKRILIAFLLPWVFNYVSPATPIKTATLTLGNFIVNC